MYVQFIDATEQYEEVFAITFEPEDKREYAFYLGFQAWQQQVLEEEAERLLRETKARTTRPGIGVHQQVLLLADPKASHGRS